jgi:hypothetical protein
MMRQVLFGTATYVPGVYSLVTKRQREGNSARYCYAVWLRHLIMAHRHANSVRPRVVVELGPGASLGVGLAALISGADTYYACDVVRQGSTERNLQLFDEIVALFRQHEAIPGDQEFPRLRPRLDDYRFPGFLHPSSHWLELLSETRLARIRESVAAGPAAGRVLQYIVPWQPAEGIPEGSVDMVCSQAVLQYVDDLGDAYRTMRTWLAPGGTMSHTIDFSAHQTSRRWDGHWTYSDLVWTLMRGKRPYWLNREPCSAHLALLRQLGFEIPCNVREVQQPEVARSTLAARFRRLSSDYLTTRGAFIMARKPFSGGHSVW